MAKLIIISGFLATMKTTISQRLSSDLNIICLNKDSFKELLGDTIGYQNREENLKLSKATFQIMKIVAQKLLIAGINVMLESNFKAYEFKELAAILPVSNDDVLSLFLVGEPHIIHERYQKRQPSRHHVHQSLNLMSYESFLASMDDYQPHDCLGKVITIDTTNFSEEMYQDILKNTKDFLE